MFLCFQYCTLSVNSDSSLCQFYSLVQEKGLNILDFFLFVFLLFSIIFFEQFVSQSGMSQCIFSKLDTLDAHFFRQKLKHPNQSNGSKVMIFKVLARNMGSASCQIRGDRNVLKVPNRGYVGFCSYLWDEIALHTSACFMKP